MEHVAPILEQMAERDPKPRRSRPSNNDPEGLKMLDEICAKYLHQAMRDSAAMQG